MYRFSVRQRATIGGVLCALVLAVTADAQTRVERVWIDVDVGIAEPADDTFAMTASIVRHGELADVAAQYSLPHAAWFDVGGGVMLTPIVGLGLSVGGSAHEHAAEVTARIPHPFFANAFGSDHAETDHAMQRVEGSLHLHAMLVAAQTRHVRLRVFAGPTYFRLEQDAVTDINYNQFYFVRQPTNVVELTGYAYERIEGAGWGFHAGADASLFFTRIIGVGGFAKFSRGSIDLENTVAGALGQDGHVSVTAGGIHVGGGVRLKF
jgi:hypothetical protein